MGAWFQYVLLKHNVRIVHRMPVTLNLTLLQSFILKSTHLAGFVPGVHFVSMSEQANCISLASGTITSSIKLRISRGRFDMQSI